jgi:hypothetical protein
VPVLGRETDAEKLAFLPPSPTITEILVLETVPETVAGFGGLVP